MNKASVIKIEIVTGDSRPIFKQIVDGISMEIATGKLAAGAKLPSYRGLAMQLMINPNTVAKAYAELSSLGLVETRKGLGLFVAEDRPVFSDSEQEERLDKAVESFINQIAHLDYSAQELLARLNSKIAKLKKKND